MSHPLWKTLGVVFLHESTRIWPNYRFKPSNELATKLLMRKSSYRFCINFLLLLRSLT